MGAGYYLALGAWEAFVGSTPFAVRLFSLLIGLLAIVMTYRIGADWFSRRVGLYAAALIASSAFFVNFMHEARAYTLVAVLELLSMRRACPDGRRPASALHALTFALPVWLILTMALRLRR